MEMGFWVLTKFLPTIINPSNSCSLNKDNITVEVTSEEDCDGDGVTNANEALDKTDPLDAVVLCSVALVRKQVCLESS